MAFERRFNAIRFYSKLNHFVLSPRKKPNHFVLKIRPGGFADYIKIVSYTQQVVSYYALADVVLVCSTFETFGRVAVEAQKCGLPLILSDVGANPERIEDGVNGLLYQKGNIAELAEKIEILRDENVRKMLSKNIDSIAIEEKYGIDNFASSFCTLLGL